jgi:hypothetical protein
VLLRKHHDAPALGRLVDQRRELRGIRELFDRDARRRNKLRGLTVAERDGTRLVEEQHVHVARGLHGAPAHGEHVLLHEPVDARDTDGAQQAADGRGD